MTPTELKAAILEAKPESKFFKPGTMRFFGDTMRNYGVRRAVVRESDGEAVECWELFRRRPVKHGLQSSAFFACDSFRQCWPSK